MDKTVPIVDRDTVYSKETWAEPILRTKLHRPPVLPDIVPRPRLVDLLEAGRHRPLTLISAAAGYGKSTLASQWLETTDCLGGWVSLDEGDNDPRLFLTYLLAAIQEVFPGLSPKTQSLLGAPELPPVATLARYLLNDLDGVGKAFILVLDDYHRITASAVHNLLAELLRHPSPKLHLALLSRRDPPLPLVALRAQGQLTEIGVEHLCFSVAETAAFLERALGVSVDEKAAARLERRMEGWVTGLRLVTLSIGQDKDAGHILEGLEGGFYHISNYLIQEVLSQVPPAAVRYLLETSVLDRFCAPLCEALRGPSGEPDEAHGMSGRAFIEWLEKTRLFVIPLDETHHWFRYHHLFQRYLQDQLKRVRGQEDMARLRTRASRWFAENDLIDEALQHAMAAEDVSYAVHLVEGHRHHLMNTEQWGRLERWLNLLPVDAVIQNPQLICTKAHIAVYRSQDSEIAASLQRAEQLLASLTPGTVEYETVQSELAVVYAVVDVVERRPTQAIKRAQSSLKLLPQQALHLRAHAIGAYALALQMQGDLKGAAAAIRDALAEHAWPEGLQARMMHVLCTAFEHEGDLASVLAAARTGLWIAEKHPAPETLSFCRYHLGVAHYLRDELTQAEAVLQALLEDRDSSSPVYLANGSFVLALIYQALDRTAEAAQVLDLLEDHFRETEYEHVQKYIRAFRVELALRQGNLVEARLLSKSVEFEGRLLILFLYVPHLTPIKLLLAEGTGESLEQARARLDALDEAMRKMNRNNVRIDALTLQALVHDALGEEPAAFEKLCTALALGEPGGFIRTFVDLGSPMADLLIRLKEGQAASRQTGYLDQILAAFPDEVRAGGSTALAPVWSGYQPANMSLSEPLTKRELKILKLLATDLSPGEIAAKLVISPGTVHTHTKNIYSKLDVHNRIQAVQRAREFGLI
jgi:LuxR family maltose regulon positive regulatory protein